MVFVLLSVSGYIFIVFFLLRLIVPFLGFQQIRLPYKIPDTLSSAIDQMHKEAISDKEYVYKCYHYLVSRFSGSRIKTFLDFFYAFQNIFIHTKGYLPCTIQNELMRVMLIKSGRFEERDIQLKVMPFDFFIHQYLLIKIEGEWIPVDNGLIS